MVWAATEAVIVPTPAPVERPKETPCESLNVRPDMTLDVPPVADRFSPYEAVTTELFDIPKETLFEFENTTVPDVAVCVPAAAAIPPPPPPAPPTIETVMDPAFVDPERVMFAPPARTN